jgi:hypothetical protein
MSYYNSPTFSTNRLRGITYCIECTNMINSNKFIRQAISDKIDFTGYLCDECMGVESYE